MENHLGLIEIMAVFALALGWGIVELVRMRIDRKKQAELSAEETDKM
jgi:hypothetical protein